MRVEIFDFLRSQQRGRLVQNECAALLVKHAQDLDPLLHADRQIFDQRLGIDAQVRSARRFRRRVRSAALRSSVIDGSLIARG